MLAILLVGFASPAIAAEQPFDEWLVDLRAEARSVGISQATLDAALSGVKPLPRVIELDRNQPEFTLTFEEYLGKFVSPWRRKTAARMLIEHADILDRVAKKYGVQKRYIVTFWGMETSFGKYLGSFNIPQSLATLAHDGRRSAYFRKELLNALRIIEDGHIKAADMKGSWAGAMGQSQFMPSSFLNFAEDWDGDGRRDIWGTTEDVFASTANYLAKAGWRDDITWGREVRLPSDLVIAGKGATKLFETKSHHPLSVWQQAGVRSADGSDLPGRQLAARLVMPEGIGGPAYLVYSNYDSILRWNRSNYYALAIGILSDSLR
ncbi:MAG: lytic murein transglycosylase [Candidatus Puniceispirillaceae bacterium]|jgi:membrane-bound lytic murein transglycosylase B